MSAATLPPVRTDILRLDKSGLKGRIVGWGMAHLGWVFAFSRRFPPIVLLRNFAAVTRYDDVREVFLSDEDFPVPYAEKLKTIMGGEPFFLGMGNTPDYRRDTAAMRSVVRPDDLVPHLTTQTEQRAEDLVNASGGRIEVVDQLARNVTFDVLCDYFGITDTPQADLRVWATRLFEYQFADPGNDADLGAEIAVMAPKLRSHVDALIAARRTGIAGMSGEEPADVLGRCLVKQAAGIDGFSDTQIRSALIGFLVGGLPQPPMVVPQALEQLLRRPAELAAAQQAARDDDDELLAGYIFEALRFDPLAPTLPRNVARDHIIAEGTSRARTIPAGKTMYVSFASAMMDPRRVSGPTRFDPRRPETDTIHFGLGLHKCFGFYINKALLPMMLKPLLKREHLRRAAGARGRLVKRGPFADALWVEF